MTLNKVKLNSFNCWGLPDRKKLKLNHSGITALQETHLTPLDEVVELTEKVEWENILLSLPVK